VPPPQPAQGYTFETPLAPLRVIEAKVATPTGSHNERLSQRLKEANQVNVDRPASAGAHAAGATEETAPDLTGFNAALANLQRQHDAALSKLTSVEAAAGIVSPEKDEAAHPVQDGEMPRPWRNSWKDELEENDPPHHVNVGRDAAPEMTAAEDPQTRPQDRAVVTHSSGIEPLADWQPDGDDSEAPPPPTSPLPTEEDLAAQRRLEFAEQERKRKQAEREAHERKKKARALKLERERQRRKEELQAKERKRIGGDGRRLLPHRPSAGQASQRVATVAPATKLSTDGTDATNATARGVAVSSSVAPADAQLQVSQRSQNNPSQMPVAGPSDSDDDTETKAPLMQAAHVGRSAPEASADIAGTPAAAAATPSVAQPEADDVKEAPKLSAKEIAAQKRAQRAAAKGAPTTAPAQSVASAEILDTPRLENRLEIIPPTKVVGMTPPPEIPTTALPETDSELTDASVIPPPPPANFAPDDEDADGPQDPAPSIPAASLPDGENDTAELPSADDFYESEDEEEEEEEETDDEYDEEAEAALDAILNQRATSPDSEKDAEQMSEQSEERHSFEKPGAGEAVPLENTLSPKELAAQKRAARNAERQLKEVALKAEEEARLKAEEEARLKAEEEARLKAEEEARLKAEEEARLKAEEEARLKAEEAARLKTEEEARLKAEEEARLKAEEEARLKAEEEARLKAEEDARLKAEKEARLKAEEAARLKVEEEARLKAEEEVPLERAMSPKELAAQKRAARKAEKRELEEARKIEEEARLKAEEETRLQAEDAARLKAEEQARLKSEEQAHLNAEEQARRKAEELSRRKAEQSEARKEATSGNDDRPLSPREIAALKRSQRKNEARETSSGVEEATKAPAVVPLADRPDSPIEDLGDFDVGGGGSHPGPSDEKARANDSHAEASAAASSASAETPKKQSLAMQDPGIASLESTSAQQSRARTKDVTLAATPTSNKLGFTMGEKEYQPGRYCVIIRKIARGDLADQSGDLRVGHIIAAINGKPVSDLGAQKTKKTVVKMIAKPWNQNKPVTFTVVLLPEEVASEKREDVAAQKARAEVGSPPSVSPPATSPLMLTEKNPFFDPRPPSAMSNPPQFTTERAPSLSSISTGTQDGQRGRGHASGVPSYVQENPEWLINGIDQQILKCEMRKGDGDKSWGLKLKGVPEGIAGPTVFISNAIDGSVAQKAGLMAYDRLLEVDGISARKMTYVEVSNHLTKVPPKTPVQILVAREPGFALKVQAARPPRSLASQIEAVNKVLPPDFKWNIHPGISSVFEAPLRIYVHVPSDRILLKTISAKSQGPNSTAQYIVDAVFRSTPMLSMMSLNAQEFDLVDVSADGHRQILAADSCPLPYMLMWPRNRLRTAYGPAPSESQPPPDCLMMIPRGGNKEETIKKKRSSIFGFGKKKSRSS